MIDWPRHERWAVELLSPLLSPGMTRETLLIAFRSPCAILFADHSRTVLLEVRDHQEQIGLDVEAAAGDTSKIDLIWVPGEGSSTGNGTGGRKFARHYFAAWASAHIVQSSPAELLQVPCCS